MFPKAMSKWNMLSEITVNVTYNEWFTITYTSISPYNPTWRLCFLNLIQHVYKYTEAEYHCTSQICPFYKSIYVEFIII